MKKRNNNSHAPTMDYSKNAKSFEAPENKRKNDPKNKTLKGKCFHCNVYGHWKRNCPKYLAELEDKKR